MAQENLMQTSNKNIKEATFKGMFHLRINGLTGVIPNTYSVILLNPVLITCGGSDGKNRADRLASMLNAVLVYNISEDKRKALWPLESNFNDAAVPGFFHTREHEVVQPSIIPPTEVLFTSEDREIADKLASLLNYILHVFIAFGRQSFR